MKTQSVEVLNEADDVTRRMDWILFKAEIDHIWDGDELAGEWVPGVALFPMPHERTGTEIPNPFDPDDYVPVGYYGNIARPMFELFEDGERYNLIRCEDCEVSWFGSDPCFVCGRKVFDRHFEFKRQKNIAGVNPFNGDPANRNRLPRDVTIFTEFDIDFNVHIFRAESGLVYSMLRISSENIIELGPNAEEIIRDELLRDLRAREVQERARQQGMTVDELRLQQYTSDRDRNLVRYSQADVDLTQQMYREMRRGLRGD